ncbi:MAG: hypothetical protein ABL919_06120 [Methylococcales bacterium]
MKTTKNIIAVSNTINADQIDITQFNFFRNARLPSLLAAMTLSLSFISSTVNAEATGTQDVKKGYRYIEYKGVANTTGTTNQDASESKDVPKTTGPNSQEPNDSHSAKDSDVKTTDHGGSITNSGANEKGENSAQPVSKPTDGKGKFPSFAQADINNDHYITKDELQNFPYLLQVFDKVDAGSDGKLEDHEYQNLLLETKREGEVR